MGVRAVSAHVGVVDPVRALHAVLVAEEVLDVVRLPVVLGIHPERKCAAVLLAILVLHRHV